MRHIVSALVLVCLLPAAAAAQGGGEKPIRAVAVQYSHLSGSGEHLDGWQTEASWNRFKEGGRNGVPGAVGLEVSLSQHYGSSDLGAGVRRTTALAGIRYFPLVFVPVYVRALAGYSRRTEDGRDSSSSPVVGVGTGLVFPVSERVFLRPIQVDYLRFAGDGRTPSSLRVAAGVSITW